MISFEDVIAANRKLVVGLDSMEDVVTGYYTKLHINKDTVPKGWFIYDIRHNGQGTFMSIEPTVTFNFAGSFLSKTPLKFKGSGYYRLKNSSDYKFI